MKITLRKKDSVIASVLFLFNLLGEHKNDRSMKLRHILQFLQYFDKSEASVRTGLSRMVKAGLLHNTKVCEDTIYTLTMEGIQIVDDWNRTLVRFFKRHGKRMAGWDGQWHFLTISGFNKSDYCNQNIVACMEECGLGEFTSNLWATAYPIDEDILRLLEQQNYSYFILNGTMESNSDIFDFIVKVFDMAKTKNKYIEFTSKLRVTNSNIKELDDSKLFPVLFDLGWDFSDIIFSDPSLPRDLLKEWPGDEAAFQMKELRSYIIPKLTSLMDKNGI